MKSIYLYILNCILISNYLYRLTTYLDTEGNSPGDKPQIWANLTDPSKNYKNGQPYDNFLRYDVGNEVTFNGSLYKLNEFIGTGHSPANKPQIWNNLTDPSKNYKNGQPYNNSIRYDVDNEVSFNGYLYRYIHIYKHTHKYVCTQIHTHTPTPKIYTHTCARIPSCEVT